MKQIYIIRHSIPNYETDSITDEGKQLCQKVKDQFPEFEIIISSSSGRARQTAFELTGRESTIDDRALLPILSPRQHQMAVEKGKQHQYGFVGALFEIKDVLPIVKAKGEELVSLIKNILDKLPGEEVALVVSHSWTMAPAKKLLLKESFDTPPDDPKYLEGYTVSEDMSVKPFTLAKSI